MKALSFSQPWLWAVLDETADKAVENRSWPPPIEMIEEQIALHAAKSFDDAGSYRLWDLGIATPDMYAKSAIVGVATIDRIVTDAKTLPELQKRWYMGPFSADGKTVYGWILKDRRKLTRPIAWDGGLGLWTVPPIVENEILAQLAGAPPSDGYKIPMLAALTAAGVASPSEWVEKHPGEHLFFVYPDNGKGIPSCVACGKVQPRDTKKNPGKPCKGIVGITMRGA